MCPGTCVRRFIHDYRCICTCTRMPMNEGDLGTFRCNPQECIHPFSEAGSFPDLALTVSIEGLTCKPNGSTCIHLQDTWINRAHYCTQVLIIFSRQVLYWTEPSFNISLGLQCLLNNFLVLYIDLLIFQKIYYTKCTIEHIQPAALQPEYLVSEQKTHQERSGFSNY